MLPSHAAAGDELNRPDRDNTPEEVIKMSLRNAVRGGKGGGGGSGGRRGGGQAFTPAQAAANARRTGLAPGARGNRVIGGAGSRRNLRTEKPRFTRTRSKRAKRGR